MKLRAKICTALLLAILLPAPAQAGGSWEPVHVKKLTMVSDTDYVLVVKPVPEQGEYKDPWLGGCPLFEVHGTLKQLDGKPWFVWWNLKGDPTKERHLSAIEYLKKYEGSKSSINFGWMGTGFNIIDNKNPCVVESRALELITDGGENGKTIAVVSYFHET